MLTPNRGLKDLLFEPDQKVFESFGVSALESLITTNEDGEILIPVENYQGLTVRLEIDTPLGTVRPAESSIANEVSATDSLPTSMTSLVKVIEHTPERMNQLMSQLNLSAGNLSSSEMTKLKTQMFLL